VKISAKVPCPTPEQIDAVHKEYVNNLQAVYAEFAHLNPGAPKELRLVE
jgi:hypothetical protein